MFIAGVAETPRILVCLTGEVGVGILNHRAVCLSLPMLKCFIKINFQQLGNLSFEYTNNRIGK